jgi:tripartite-type tricarboxylate transporter receptor subunit TctC
MVAMAKMAILGWVPGLLVAAGVCASAPASAQVYPERPVSIIVPVAAGAAPDVIARILADRLGQRWKQQVLVVNRPGGGGVIGAQAAAGAAADGYTLYMPLSSAFTIVPESKTRWPVDLMKDFATIGLICDQPMTVAVTPKLEVNTLDELNALAKRRPNDILYGPT